MNLSWWEHLVVYVVGYVAMFPVVWAYRIRDAPRRVSIVTTLILTSVWPIIVCAAVGYDIFRRLKVEESE